MSKFRSHCPNPRKEWKNLPVTEQLRRRAMTSFHDYWFLWLLLVIALAALGYAQDY